MNFPKLLALCVTQSAWMKLKNLTKRNRVPFGCEEWKLFFSQSTKVWKEKTLIKIWYTRRHTNIHTIMHFNMYTRNTHTNLVGPNQVKKRGARSVKYTLHAFEIEKDNKAKMRTKSDFFSSNALACDQVPKLDIQPICMRTLNWRFLSLLRREKIETIKCHFDSGFTLNNVFLSACYDLSHLLVTV